ncbi:MAG: hypothetical protein ACR2HD_04285 [Solirubrobacteraceae bacterium]
MRRAALLAFLVIALSLLLATPAFARHGIGLYGVTNDKVVTNAAFLLIAFFPLFVAFMSFVQWRLDRRKEARKSALKARAQSAQWRAGW